ncbi:hypothetical protein N7510_006636 [Penicillium lagena]|uniref:uncharacterized protein n=1 Tax=Penicillium lagena TaxID=94218 RepID=UPI002540444E|nr:uncharacterized protein N7510_006636 [Penicillium lagena]KAJ5613442.1 hypothetical protein N7510_006636 [Penicillium lagena]
MHIRGAAIQAEPEWLDLEASVKKTCKLISQASQGGAQIVAFPELWLFCILLINSTRSRPIDFTLNTEYFRNSLMNDSHEMAEICQCAAENNIVVCLGYSERYCGSVYIAQCTINSDGALLMARRKLKPVHMERTIFGDGNGPSLRNVVQTSIGRVGALSCGEHYQPLLKYHTFFQNEEIHVSAWPPVVPHPGGSSAYSMSKEGVEAASRLYSIESQAFTLHSTNTISDKGVDKLVTNDGHVFNAPGGGSSAIFGPDGRKLTEDLTPTEEGIVYADLDFDQILKEKALLDSCGHNSRPDLLWLGVNAEEQKHVRNN